MAETNSRSGWKIDPGNIINVVSAGIMLAMVIGVWRMHDDILVVQTKMENVGNKLGTVDKMNEQLADHEHRITHLEDTVLDGGRK